MELYEYLGKRLLCWITYNRSFVGPNRLVYAYPRVMLLERGGVPVPEDAFPSKGAFELRISDEDLDAGHDAEWYCEHYGPLSVVCIPINKGVEYKQDRNNFYRMWLRQERDMGAYIEKAQSAEFHEVVDSRHPPELDNPSWQLGAIHPLCLDTVMLRVPSGTLYGPFGVDRERSSTRLRGLQAYGYKVAEYPPGACAGAVWSVRDANDNEVATVVQDSALEMPAEREKSWDWIPDDKLVDIYVQALAGAGEHGRADREKFRDMARKILEMNPNDVLTPEREARLQSYLETSLAEDTTRDKITKALLEDANSRQTLVEDAVSRYSDLIRDDLRGAGIRRISELESQVEKLRRQNAELKKKADLLQDPAVFTEEIRRLGQDRDAMREQVESEKTALASLDEQLQASIQRFSSEADRIARAADSAVLRRLLGEAPSTVPPGSAPGIAEHSLPQRARVASCPVGPPMSEREIISQVATYISEHAKRRISENDVANYLICITQGFITTFAGIPGTGKTSLCRILAHSLGLARDDDSNRFVDVSVERGWNSVKDFIGYYNPLTRAFEKSNAEVYDAFARMDAECGSAQAAYEAESVAPFLVLLDEANLSPMEHYWAAFLRNCDLSDTARRSLSLGGDRILRIAPHLRFLATVNFDYTTEDLSPRFVDRSWIITLMPQQIEDEAEELPSADAMVSYADLTGAFARRGSDQMDETVASKWEHVQKLFADNNLPISPRNLKMVRDYCAVASRCMSLGGPSSKLAPLDYALSQKILPTINGAGEQYRRLVDDLLNTCVEDTMPLSAMHLARMKKGVEENAGFTQFFIH